MDTYIAALESFDKELGDIYFDYQMQSFVGMEAAGVDFKAKLRAGWDSRFSRPSRTPSSLLAITSAS